MSFQAVVLRKQDQSVSVAVESVDESQLPDADVCVAIQYSTLNYKDGLAITHRSPIVRQWPMVPGIDGVGEVISSRHPAWHVGDSVLLNGFGVGEGHWGCLAQKAALKGEWLIHRPESLSARDCMAIGTAGYTAMLSVLALEQQGVLPEAGEVLVTGATGGVGAYAVAILANLGYHVVASTGSQETEFLTQLGAREVIARDVLSAPGKPLQKERWAAVIDSVGSHTLVNACAQTRYGGVVTACGLAQGMDFPSTVMPFILRGVRLIGVDSVMASIPLREKAWHRLSKDVTADNIARITAREIGLSDVVVTAQALMEGAIRGRVVVDVNR